MNLKLFLACVGLVAITMFLLAPAPRADLVVCEPQGGGNPFHPPIYWYDVTTTHEYT
jgi:hypothetical protein